MVTLLQHTIHGSSPWGNTVTYSSSGYVAKHPWDVVLRSMAISSNQLHWEQHFFVSDCRPQHTTGVMSIWRFHVCFFIDCIFMILLKSDSLNANPESRALLAQIKHLGMGLMHKSRWSITQVYNGQLTLLTETLTQRESSKDTFFFHCAQRYAVWEAAYHLWCKVTAKWPTQQCVLPITNQTAFQFGHIYSFPVLFMFELCLTISYIYMFHD